MADGSGEIRSFGGTDFADPSSAAAPWTPAPGWAVPSPMRPDRIVAALGRAHGAVVPAG